MSKKKKQSNTTNMSRRAALGAAATLGGSLLVRSLATGIPAKVLLDPMSATAADLPTGKVLILSVSSDGDPVNANVPGTYKPGIFHPQDPAMAETALTLSGVPYTAAKPWADLPQNVLDRTVFFHHATYTPVHGEMARVQKMMEATEKSDMLISLLAHELAPILGTVQRDPVSLGANGGELLSASGRVLGNVAPLSVRQALGGVDGALKDLTTLRDAQIDRIYALYKDHGTPSQRTLLDAWARSRDEVRDISTALVSRLDVVDGNDQANQARTAAVLAAMGIAPVITINLRFGRDNHTDADLATETEEHLTAIPVLQELMADLDQLKSEGMQHDVVVGSLNVFGRTLVKKGYEGRDHHSGHHCMVLMGNGVRGGVVGGVELNEKGTEYISQAIDSTSGAIGGDIPYEESLASAGRTMGRILGVSTERLDEMLPPGKVVTSACA